MSSIDITGERYGMIVALRLATGMPTGQGAYWVFACDCGQEATIRMKDVRFGNTLSCGCLKHKVGARYGQPKIVAARPWRTAQTIVDKYAERCARYRIAVPGMHTPFPRC